MQLFFAAILTIGFVGGALGLLLTGIGTMKQARVARRRLELEFTGKRESKALSPFGPSTTN